MATTAPGPKVNDEDRLAQLGNKQELTRTWSGFSNFAVSFTIISILALITIIFRLPFTPAAVPFAAEFDWNAVNYAPIMVGGLFLIVGAWWLLGARRTSTGPVRNVEFDDGLGVASTEPVRTS